jgi:hypothetical protein
MIQMIKLKYGVDCEDQRAQAQQAGALTVQSQLGAKNLSIWKTTNK